MSYIKPLILVKGLHEEWNFSQLRKHNFGCCQMKELCKAIVNMEVHKRALRIDKKDLNSFTKGCSDVPVAGAPSTHSINYWRVLFLVTKSFFT